VAPLPAAERLTRAGGRRAWQRRGSGMGWSADGRGNRRDNVPHHDRNEALTGESTMSAWSTDALRTWLQPTTCTSHPTVGTGRRTAHQRGCGPSRSMTLAMCARTTASTLAGNQAALRQKAGRVTAAGITKDVSCEPVNGAIDVAILFWTNGDKNRPETSTR
jgi:hypothetical protein